MDAQTAAEKALKEKADVEQQIQTLTNEKTAAESALADRETVLSAERDALTKRIQELEDNLVAVQTQMEARLNEKSETPAPSEQIIADKAEMEKLAVECTALKNRVQTLEMQLRKAENMVEAGQREKREADKKLQSITLEKEDIEQKLETTFSAKINAEKELYATMKENEFISLQMEEYKRQSHRPISNALMTVLLILPLAAVIYAALVFHDFPNQLVKVDKQVQSLATRFDEKIQVLDTLSLRQSQMAARVDALYKDSDSMKRDMDNIRKKAADHKDHNDTKTKRSGK